MAATIPAAYLLFHYLDARGGGGGAWTAGDTVPRLALWRVPKKIGASKMPEKLLIVYKKKVVLFTFAFLNPLKRRLND